MFDFCRFRLSTGGPIDAMPVVSRNLQPPSVYQLLHVTCKRCSHAAASKLWQKHGGGVPRTQRCKV